MTLLEHVPQVELETSPPDQEASDNESSIGSLLRTLRGTKSLRQVESDTGIPNSYVSNIEKGHKNPGLKTLRRLAMYYGISLQDLLHVAGLTRPKSDEAGGTSVVDVQRSYNYIVADPSLSFIKPASDMPIDGKRFVVELYQFYTGRKLL